jgi:hypothetical protein
MRTPKHRRAFSQGTNNDLGCILISLVRFLSGHRIDEPKALLPFDPTEPRLSWNATRGR